MGVHRIRQDFIYLSQGITGTFAVMGAIGILSLVLLLFTVAIAPGRLGDIMSEALPDQAGLILLPAALIEGVYVWVIARIRLIPRRLGFRLIYLVSIATLVGLVMAVFT